MPLIIDAQEFSPALIRCMPMRRIEYLFDMRGRRNRQTVYAWRASWLSGEWLFDLRDALLLSTYGRRFDWCRAGGRRTRSQMGIILFNTAHLVFKAATMEVFT